LIYKINFNIFDIVFFIMFIKDSKIKYCNKGIVILIICL